VHGLPEVVEGRYIGGGMSLPEEPDAARGAQAANRRFYDELWSASYLVSPERFNTWPELSALAATGAARLEVGPGLRPRLPVAGTHFVDVSEPALARLREGGGHALLGDVTTLPFRDGAFDLVCAFDIVEHVEDDRRVFAELSRVARRGAVVVFSVPLHQARWTSFDALVGHVRRYEPGDLLALLREHRLALERTAVFGMEPRSRWLMEFAAWGLSKRRTKALRWYNAVLLPVGLLTQRRLEWRPGLVDVAGVGEILLACRRQ
jgi:SAM-dependent methyltransferase